MKSFYELLGSNADDDVEALKKAFRKAVRAHHPDLYPGDPDAPSRFQQLVAANALLRDAKQRAADDRLLQLERQQFQLQLERQQLRSKLEHQQFQLQLERQQLRLKRMRTTVAVAVIGAFVGGYALFAAMPTAIVRIKKDEQAATTGAEVQKDRQTATVVAATNENERTLTAIAVTKAEAVKGDNAGQPVEKVAALLQGIADRKVAPGPLPNDANFYRERGISAYRSSDFLGAIGNFDEAIRLNPDDAQSHNIRGNVWDELGIFERALADYDESIRIDSNNPAVFHDRAILWQRQGALDTALVDLDRAIRFSFSDPNMYCDRGLVWYEKGRLDRAVADFNQATKLDPNFATACIKGGLMHRNSAFKLASGIVNQM